MLPNVVEFNRSNIERRQEILCEALHNASSALLPPEETTHVTTILLQRFCGREAELFDLVRAGLVEPLLLGGSPSNNPASKAATCDATATPSPDPNPVSYPVSCVITGDIISIRPINEDANAPNVVAEVVDVVGSQNVPLDVIRVRGRIIAGASNPKNKGPNIFDGIPCINKAKWPGREGEAITVSHPAASLVLGLRAGRKWFSIRKYGEANARAKAEELSAEWQRKFETARKSFSDCSMCFCNKTKIACNNIDATFHVRGWQKLDPGSPECIMLKTAQMN